MNSIAPTARLSKRGMILGFCVPINKICDNTTTVVNFHVIYFDAIL